MSSTPLVGNTFFGLDISQLGRQLASVRRRLSKRLLLLEFSSSGLRYAEASPSLDGIRFRHISRVPLPEEALERGVPSDPTMMATLLKALCQEKQIPAHRAAVVLAPEVAYQRVIELPRDLSLAQARSYIRDPANAVPLPFPLDQTDYDLYPLSVCQGSDVQAYLLIALPRVLVDRVISLLDQSGLELQALELGPFCVLRFLADELISLRQSEFHLVLELLPDCSQLCVVTSAGPIRFERLSAIRDFPDPDLDADQCKEALDAGLSAEQVSISDDRYLPISELDLRAVVRDVKAVISDLMSESDLSVVHGLTLSGINSAHPLIKDLFHAAFDCPVKVLNPVLMSRVAGFSPDDLLVQAGLARLMGLGLGFLPHEQLLSCQLPRISSPLVSEPRSLAEFEALIEVNTEKSALSLDPLDVELVSISSDSFTVSDREVSSEKVVEETVEEEVLESEEEEEWPSLRVSLEKNGEVEKVDDETVEEEVWRVRKRRNGQVWGLPLEKKRG